MIDWLCDCALTFIIVFMLDVCRKGHSSFQPSSPGAFSFSKIVSYKELGSFKCPCFSILTILIQRYLGLVSQMR
ncbi:hypothetical protein RHGRI_019903 [Rhododendron griersonianum]|uniref:Uncharacterized protein n=1 Tax=Rhododendron griersonianum TaxID=479676 RepID=A0AAV6JJB0_9ERIC|nr:hypothetical protein RHGRI_019903 [Rhododendron griersonianum]